MKKIDLAVIATSVLIVLAFIIFMFNYYLRSEETQIIKKNTYYDSMLLERQNKLMLQDSLMKKSMIDEGFKIKNSIHNHEYRINRLEKAHETIIK